MTQNNSIPVPPKPDQKSNIPVPPSPNLERSDISQASIEPQQAKAPIIVLDDLQSFGAEHGNKIQDLKIKMIENKKPLIVIGGVFILLLVLALGGYSVYQGSSDNDSDNETVGLKNNFQSRSEDVEDRLPSGRSETRAYTNERGTWDQVDDDDIEFEGANEKWSILDSILEYEGSGHKWYKIDDDVVRYDGVDGSWSRVDEVREYTDPEGRHYDVVDDVKYFNIDGKSFEQAGDDVKRYNDKDTYVSDIDNDVIDHQTDDTSYHQVGDIKEIDE